MSGSQTFIAVYGAVSHVLMILPHRPEPVGTKRQIELKNHELFVNNS
jgi:hypothetical protein